MYKIPKNEETKEFISVSAKLLTDGGKNDEYAYDERLINEIISKRTYPFSNDFIRIIDFFKTEGVFDFDYMEGALFCIAYCFGHKAKQNPENWDKVATGDYNKLSNAPQHYIRRLFGKDTSFWIAFLSKQMFDYYGDTKEFEISDLLKFISLAAHNGALLLEEKYLDLQKTYKYEPYKAVSQFLLDLAELAGRNVPPPPPEPPTGGDEQPPEPPQNKTNADKSKDILNALEKCKIPAESVIFSAEGMRYDIYEVKLKEPYILSNKDIEKISQSLWGKDILGESVKGKSLTLNIKILKPENEWKVFEDNEFQRALQEYKDNFELPICLGLDELGEPIFKDFSQAPHAIIGGTTRSGKSVALKGMIHSLLTLTPKENLELFILDPKKVEYQKLSQKYDNLSLITENDEMVSKINELADEMEKRYSILQEKMVEKLTDITTENRPFKFIVAIIDELANLLTQEEDLAEPLAMIAEKGAAAGIHLLLSTQRPDADALGRKGSRLRANLPTKIGFKVDKEANSKIILDEIGAEKLAGKGDHFIKWFGGEKVFLHGYNLKG